MQKVYLLLRSNQQQGPFNLDELLQFELKPHDLIWVEGRSAGWYYPQEIEALRPHLSFLQNAPLQVVEKPIKSITPIAEPSPTKIFVSMPVGNAAKKEITPLSLVQPEVQETKPAVASETSRQADEVKTTYAKSIEEVETDYMNWAYQKKTRKKQLISNKAAFAICLLASAAFAAWWLLQPSGQASAGKTIAAQTVTANLPNELSIEENTGTKEATENRKPVLVKKQKPEKTIGTAKQQMQKAAPKAKEETAVTVASDQPTYEPPPVVNEQATPVTDEKNETVIPDAPKEKKKLRDKIADLFRKKPQDKEAKPVEEEDGRRQSTRREAGSNLAQLITVQFEIPNDWMMGINGAKATLANRSSELVARAVIEVIYYNDDNDVLARKTINFTNVKSKQSQTVSVPDHQTATRLEYNVVSAVGAGEPVARM